MKYNLIRFPDTWNRHPVLLNQRERRRGRKRERSPWFLWEKQKSPDQASEQWHPPPPADWPVDWPAVHLDRSSAGTRMGRKECRGQGRAQGPIWMAALHRLPDDLEEIRRVEPGFSKHNLLRKYSEQGTKHEVWSSSRNTQKLPCSYFQKHTQKQKISTI